MKKICLKAAVALAVVLSIHIAAPGAFAQSEEDVKASLAKVVTLLDAGKYLEAEPHLAKLVALIPDSPELRLMYGVVLVYKSKQIDDTEEAKKASALALEQFQAAKRLGSTEPQVDTMIEVLGGGTGKPPAPASDFEQAEVKFAQSKYDEALVLYKKALEADPKNYLAALYSADCLMQLQKYDEAEVYYKKAIAIDPDRETAYRYSATYLLKQRKFDEARDRCINAVLAEPYNKMSYRGIEQWAQLTNTGLADPKITYPAPTDVLDTASPWSAYRSTRQQWQKSKFAETFPSEKAYRHSLREEAEAIRAAIKAASAVPKLDPAIAADIDVLKKIEADGLLEAYILLSEPDQGIAGDYAAYRKENIAKLRQYFMKYVIQTK